MIPPLTVAFRPTTRPYSRTAELMAMQRALESNRPPRSRMFNDPYAAGFTRGSLALLARLSEVPWAGRLAPHIYDWVAGPGPRPSAIVRTRLIDELINSRAVEFEQFAILGAGFDTRAHRLSSVAALTIFEVDHPVTQRHKRDVLSRLRVSTIGVHYVGLDFEHDSLTTRLKTAGFDPDQRTLLLWEGVTNYLSASAVDQTLAAIRTLAHNGTLIFTYVDRGVLDGTVNFPEAAKWLRGVQRAGEPWTFGLRPAEAQSFLTQRGYKLERDVTTREAGDELFAAVGRRERGSALYHVVAASVI